MRRNRKQLPVIARDEGEVGRGGRDSQRAGGSFQGDSYVPDLDGGDGFMSACLAKSIRLHSSDVCILVYQLKLFKNKQSKWGSSD